MALNKDALLTAVLAASGGKQVVKYNVNGDPCFFTRIPRFNLEDINPALGTGPHPAFVVNGVIKDEIFIGTYQAIFEKNCAISIPGQSPKASINYNQAKAACELNGPGFHLMTAWERAAIILWCLKNGFQPRGNTSSGKSSEATWETGTPAPDYADKTLAGSGPASWRHDGTMAGISDLVGNVDEWLDGLKSIDGRLYFPNDNDFTMDDAQWPASPVYLDTTTQSVGDRGGGVVDSGDVVLNDRILHYSETPTPAGGTDIGDFDVAQNLWTSCALSSTYDALALEKRQQAAQLVIAPKLESTGDALFTGLKGVIFSRNYGERRPYWGGDWSLGANAGLACVFLYYRPVASAVTLGLRPAFIL